ncbi:hypothetical protein ACXR8F_17780 [Terrabacter sp. AAH1]
MKISWLPRDETGRQGFRAEVGPYDAVPPIDTLFLDGAPLLMSADRMGVAASLVFGRFASGPLELPRSCSPAAASAITAFLAPVSVSVSPVDHEPRALPIGAGLCVAAEERDEFSEPQNAWGERRRFTVRSMRSDRYSGSLASMTSLSLATNGWLLSDAAASPLAKRLPSLAVTVLYAETLQVDEIMVPDLESDPALAARLGELLASVRLGLSPLSVGAAA